MRTKRRASVTSLCDQYGADPLRLMDIVLAVQREYGGVNDDAVDAIADRLGIPRVRVQGVVGFYSFLSPTRVGQTVIRLCRDVPDEMKGSADVATSLQRELQIDFGETTDDGRFTLEYASCIGMSDQAPAALVNDVVVPRLGPDKARELVQTLRTIDDPVELSQALVRSYGDGNNAHDLVRAAVHNNLRHPGAVIFAQMERGAALGRALALSPVEVIREVKTARLRGRGGAGFPTGMKWEFTRAADGTERTLICNADEGEPGTFKDRVILTERPDLVFEGMTIGGYAIGASVGIVYLRAEYAYLREFLEHVLERRRADDLLGMSICGREGFDFDIRIQMGAGAYICGEETALINSCEGLRGEPRTRPPFPAQAGYLGGPTSVNNVETLCCAARILEMGSAWFSSMGSSGSSGTKLLSISGDCTRPGVYEVELGTPLAGVLEMCGAETPIAVQVGGPSGRMVGADEFGRQICFDDLATGGALVVLGPGRDPVAVAAGYMEFFAHESCGYCAPCRVGTTLIKDRVDRILAGRGESSDLEYLESLCETVRTTSRCGLGQTAPNPVLSTLSSFRSAYEAHLVEPEPGLEPGFDIRQELSMASELTGRDSTYFKETV